MTPLLPETSPNAGLRPPLTLALGPAGAGKTDWALQRFLEAEGRALLVVASTPQAETLARLLAERASRPEAELRGAITPFHGLVAALLQPAVREDYRLIGRDFQRLLLNDLFRTHIRPDDFLGRMLDAPGFVPALCERVREWKLACITPDSLEQGAHWAAETLEDPAFLRKTSELARLFRAYETFLHRNRLRDEEDCLRAAAARLADAPTALPNLILLDGFYRFNRAQRLLLAALAGRGLESGQPEVEVALTLPYAADRPLLFVAPERTLTVLRAEFNTRELLLPSRSTTRPSLLTTLASCLFDIAPGERGGDCENAESAPDSPAPLLIFDAPNPYVEAEMVAREFRRLQAERGYAWSDFAVILRGMGDYAPILAAVFERYAIPLGVDGPEALAENPLLKTLLTLLSVVRQDWPREEVLAFLKSSYTAPNKVEADHLRRAAQSAGVREGRARWLALLSEASLTDRVAETVREMSRLHDLLRDYRGAPIEFIELLKECITAFGLEERIATGERNRIERDREALKQGLALLEDLAQMALLSGKNRMTFAEFHDALLMAWEGAASLVPAGRDVVCVCEPYDTRERPLKVAAVMGLTERVFPRRIAEDPFLRDEERVALQERGGLDLEIWKGRVDDERFLFYLAVTAPSEVLRLSYPRSSNESDTLPSFYLDEVRSVLDGIGQSDAGPRNIGAESLPGQGSPAAPSAQPSVSYTLSRTLADVAPRPDECVTDHDRLRAACAGLFDPGPAANPNTAQIRRRAGALMTSCLESDIMRSQVHAVVASRFLPRLPRLEAPDLRAHFIGQDRAYTITELEAYQRCPFQYLLRHVLRLRPEEEAADTRVQGALLHEVLRRYYRRHAPSKANQAAPDLDTMRAELRVLLAEQLERETLDAPPSRLLMVRQLLESGLDRFAERELRFREQFGMAPAHAHLAFGMDSAVVRATDPFREEEEFPLPGEENTHDPASCAEPLLLHGADGGPPVALCGTIDRVDHDATGRALMLDYRLETPPEFDEIQRGQSLLLPLSLLALERVFGKVGAAACYDALFEDGRRRLFRTEHVNLRQFAPLLPLDDPPTVRPLNRNQFADLTKTAEETAVRTARAIAGARIEATPGKQCRACSYSDVCRTNLEGVHDGESPA